MALSPYRDVNSSPQRSRSSSFSTPSTSFLYQEVLNIGENTLIKSYSCDQIFQKLKDGQVFQSTYIQVSSFVSPIKRVSKPPAEDGPLFLTMSKKKKKKSIKIKLKRALRSVIDFVCIHANVPYIFLHVILFALLINLVLKNNECNKTWNITDTVYKLQNNVFGQQAAVNKIEIILNEFNNSNNSLIVAFTGTVGVGKTLVSSIIYDNFPWSTNEHINFFNDELEENISGKKYSFCSANLLIIDGLHTSTAKTAISKIVKLMNSLKNNQKLLVIIIFQIQSENDEVFILKNLEYEKFKFYHVPFKNLNEKTILECFKAELKRQNKSISSVNLNELVKQQMKICPISKSLPGCKNVFHEVSFLPNNA